MSAKQLKVAIVHDWLIGGGAERVVEELHHLYPEAPIYTSYCSPEWRQRLDGKVITGYLQKWPFSTLRKFLPLLRQWWFAGLKLDDFDLIISSAGNGEAKHVKAGPNTTHVNYCHSPVHFYWGKYDEYRQHPSFRPHWLARLGLQLLVRPLRKADYRAAQRVDYFIANSSYIQAAIKKYYDRDSVVIFPPVNTARFSNDQKAPRSGFVIAGRQVPYKRLDIAIKACVKLQLPLTVIGNGPEHANLRKLDDAMIDFVDNASDKEVENYFRHAEAFIFPTLEDFGITPVEAMAAGTPVIAYKGGGALDYVVPGKTGEFFDKQTPASLQAILKEFKSSAYSPKTIAAEAEKYSNKAFANRLTNFIASLK